MNIEQRIQAARLAIANYERVIFAFESGAAIPDVGELLGNRLLLGRKRRQLKALEVTRATMNKHKLAMPNSVIRRIASAQ